MNASQAPKFFDRPLYAARKQRAAARYGEVDFLLREASERLVDKLQDVRQSFGTVVNVGARQGQLGQVLHARLGIVPFLSLEMSPAMLAGVASGWRVVADEEWLPLRDESVELILSAMSVHMVNDLVGVLIQMRRALRAGGLMMLNMIGGASLQELRFCLAQAEAEMMGGVSPRVIPMIDVRDAGDLLARTGFALPVADSETLTISYPDMWALMKDIRMMGGANALTMRPRSGVHKALFARAAELYQQHYADAEGRISVTIELISLTGWRE
jgi:NADH dehydrogenase [ubiquinone] 1 alpha subcomplex assembly factor 5